MSPEPTHESKPFDFIYQGRPLTAFVRYYDDGEMDIETQDEAQGKAWEVAESLGLLTR
jgi:hypothetical protein